MINGILTDTIFAEIRFKNNGLDLIEVQDNGGGIAPENYDGLGTFLYIHRMLRLSELVLITNSTQALHVQTLDLRRPHKPAHLRFPRRSVILTMRSLQLPRCHSASPPSPSSE